MNELVIAAVDLRAQIRNVGFDDVRAALEIVAPHDFQQMIFAEDPARLAHEHLEQVEFTLREFEGILPAPCFARGGIDRQVAPAQHFLFYQLRAAEFGLQARDELFEDERLDEIIVGARAQARALCRRSRPCAVSMRIGAWVISRSRAAA